MKVVSFEEAVSTIHDGDTLLIGGSGGGHAVPEALIVALKAEIPERNQAKPHHAAAPCRHRR